MPTSCARGRERRLGAGAREAEVGEEGVVAVADEHVVRLDVAVHEADGVRGVERVGDLAEQVERAPRVERAVADQVDERRPVDQAHREVQAVVGLAGVVDRDDVRMVERAPARGPRRGSARRGAGPRRVPSAMSLSATTRPDSTSRARKTAPMPPRPSSSSMR